MSTANNRNERNTSAEEYAVNFYVELLNDDRFDVTSEQMGGNRSLAGQPRERELVRGDFLIPEMTCKHISMKMGENTSQKFNIPLS